MNGDAGARHRTPGQGCSACVFRDRELMLDRARVRFCVSSERCGGWGDGARVNIKTIVDRMIEMDFEL